MKTPVRTGLAKAIYDFASRVADEILRGLQVRCDVCHDFHPPSAVVVLQCPVCFWHARRCYSCEGELGAGRSVRMHVSWFAGKRGARFGGQKHKKFLTNARPRLMVLKGGKR